MGMALNPSLDLTWREYAMPDASGAVQLARLPSLAPDHFWALVQFPPNWRRIRPGHYSVDEDFLLLHGDLTINDQLWRAREHGLVPAHAWRGQTHAMGARPVHASMADPNGMQAQRRTRPRKPADTDLRGPHGRLSTCTAWAWHKWLLNSRA